MAKNKLSLSSIEGIEENKFNESIENYNNKLPDDEKLTITPQDKGLEIQLPEPTNLNITIRDGEVILPDGDISPDQMKLLLSFFYSQAGVTNVSIPEDANPKFIDAHQETVATYLTEEEKKDIEELAAAERVDNEDTVKRVFPEEATNTEEDKAFNPLKYWKKYNKDENDYVKHTQSLFGKYPQTLQFFKDEEAYEKHGEKEGKGKFKNNVLFQLKQTGPNTFVFSSPGGGNTPIDARYFDQTAKFLKKSGKSSLKFGRNLTAKDREELFKACGKRALIPISPYEKILLTEYDDVINAYKGNKNSNEQMSFDKNGEPIKDNLIDYEYRLAQEVIKAYGGEDKITPSYFRQKIKTAVLNKKLQKYFNPKYDSKKIDYVRYDPTISDDDKKTVLEAYGKAGVVPTDFVLESSDVDALIAAYAKNGFSGGEEARYKSELAKKIREAHVANNIKNAKNLGIEEDINKADFDHFKNFPNGELLKKLNYHIVENRWELGKGGEPAKDVILKSTGEKVEIKSNAVSFAEEYIPHTDAKIMQSIRDLKLKPKDKNELYTKCGREGVIPVGYSRAPGGGELSSFQGGLKNFHMVSSFIDGGGKYEDSDVAMDRVEKLVKNVLDLDGKDFNEGNVELVNAKIAEKYNLNSDNPDDAKSAQGGKIQISKMFTEYAIYKASKEKPTEENSVDGIVKVSFPEYLTGGLDKELLKRAGKKGLIPVFEKKPLTAEYIEAFKIGLKENKYVAGAKNDNAYEQKVLKSLAKSVLGLSDDKDYGDYKKLKEALDNKFGKDKAAASDSAHKALLAVIAESNIYEKDNTDEEKTAENSINDFRKVIVPHGMEYNDNMKMLEKAAENSLIPTGIELDAKGFEKLITTFNSDPNNSAKDKLNFALGTIQSMKEEENPKLKTDEVLNDKIKEILLKNFLENEFRDFSDEKSKIGPISYLATKRLLNEFMGEVVEKCKTQEDLIDFIKADKDGNSQALDYCKNNFEKAQMHCIEDALITYTANVNRTAKMSSDEFMSKFERGSISVPDNVDYGNDAKFIDTYNKEFDSASQKLITFAGDKARFDVVKSPVNRTKPTHAGSQISSEMRDLLDKFAEKNANSEDKTVSPLADFKKVNLVLESGKSEYITDKETYKDKLAAMMAINEVSVNVLTGDYEKDGNKSKTYNQFVDKKKDQYLSKIGDLSNSEIHKRFEAEVNKFDKICVLSKSKDKDLLKGLGGDYNDKLNDENVKSALKKSSKVEGINSSARSKLDMGYRSLDARAKESQIENLNNDRNQEVERPKTSKPERRTANGVLRSTIKKLEEREDLDSFSQACLKMAAIDLHNDINEGDVSPDRVADNLSYYAKSYRGAVVLNNLNENEWVESVNNEIEMFNEDKSNSFTLNKIIPSEKEKKKEVKVTGDNSESLVKATKRARARNDQMRDKASHIKRGFHVNDGAKPQDRSRNDR